MQTSRFPKGIKINFLFYTRFLLYMLVFLVPVLHPAIIVPYDYIGWIFFFLIIPGLMLSAFYFSPLRFNFRLAVIVPMGAVVLGILALAGISWLSLYLLLAAALVYLLTLMIFNGRLWGNLLATLEIFSLGYIYYRMLSYSRASEEIAAQSSGITQTIFIISILAFLVHSIVLYLAAFETNRNRKTRSEIITLAGIIIPVFLLFSFILPKDFVRNSKIVNMLNPEKQNRVEPLDGEDGGEDGALKGQKKGRDGGLEGVNPGDWINPGRSGKGMDNRQRSVMVVASDHFPLYLANAYFERLDKEQGFVKRDDQVLNALASRRLLEIWTNQQAEGDLARQRVDYFVIGVYADKYLNYNPLVVEPTILNHKYAPFSYHYRATSSLSLPNQEKWSMESPKWNEVKELTGNAELESYLEVPLPLETQKRLKDYLAPILPRGATYNQKIIAILKSFAAYQYGTGFDDDVSIAKLQRFLFETKEGDCTEFSNTAALLGRIAGIPSRVVVGYLVSKSFEEHNPAFTRALRIFRFHIEYLKEYNLDQLCMVTDAQLHSWVQFYLPGYGWTDFESTQYAIPPLPGSNPSDFIMVIPNFMETEEIAYDENSFPWLFLGIFLSASVILIVLSLYGIKSFKFIAYTLIARQNSKRGMIALYRLLLMHLALHRYDLKPYSDTPVEYAKRYPLLAGFAELYTRFIYNPGLAVDEKKELCGGLRTVFQTIIKNLPAERHVFILRRIFSLRSLYY